MTFVESAGQILTELSDKIGSALTQIAQVAGDVVAHLYFVLIKQQVVIGIQYAVTSIWFILLTFLLYRFGKKTFSNKDIHVVDKTILCIIIGLAGLWTASRGLNFLNISLPYIINPEYRAIIEAVGLVKQLK